MIKSDLVEGTEEHRFAGLEALFGGSIEVIDDSEDKYQHSYQHYKNNYLAEVIKNLGILLKFFGITDTVQSKIVRSMFFDYIKLSMDDVFIKFVDMDETTAQTLVYDFIKEHYHNSWTIDDLCEDTSCLSMIDPYELKIRIENFEKAFDYWVFIKILDNLSNCYGNYYAVRGDMYSLLNNKKLHEITIPEVSAAMIFDTVDCIYFPDECLGIDEENCSIVEEVEDTITHEMVTQTVRLEPELFNILNQYWKHKEEIIELRSEIMEEYLNADDSNWVDFL